MFLLFISLSRHTHTYIYIHIYIHRKPTSIDRWWFVSSSFLALFNNNTFEPTGLPVWMILITSLQSFLIHEKATPYISIHILYLSIYIYTLNIVLCLRHFLLLAARNHECGPVAKLSKKSGTKGDCISIAKKLKLLDEFHELKNSGVKNANQDMCFDQNDILLLSRFGSKRTDYSAFKNSWCTFCSRCVCVHMYVIYIYMIPCRTQKTQTRNQKPNHQKKQLDRKSHQKNQKNNKKTQNKQKQMHFPQFFVLFFFFSCLSCWRVVLFLFFLVVSLILLF